MINCRDLLCLPTLGHLLGLKTLRIEGMNKLEDIGPGFYGESSIVAFQSLQELHIKDFPVLENWCSMEDRSIFPLLMKLTIKNWLDCMPPPQPNAASCFLFASTFVAARLQFKNFRPRQ